MNKKLFRTLIVSVLVLGIAFAGFSGLKAVFAQTTTPETPETTEAPATPSTAEDEVLPGRGYMMGSDDSALAEALGKTAAELQAARKTAYDLAVDQALADGAITEAQATQLKANSGNGWGVLARFVGSDELAKLDEKALFAQALGITVDELNAAYAKVRADRLAALVASGRLTQEQADLMAAQEALQESSTFQADVKAGMEAAIQKAVEAGTITQAQADALIAKLQSSTGWGMGFGGFGGMHGGLMNGKGMRGQGMQGKGGQGMFGQGQNGTCDGTCQYAPDATNDGTDG